jgi:hypothetical protein
MIRVALAELGLSVTAQALPYEGWDEEGLAALQRNWESVNLLDAAERCVAGERVFGLQMLAQLRQQSTTNTPSAMRAASSGSGTRPDLKDRLLERLGSMLWRTHIDQDELFYIRHYQETLEAWRELRANDNWAPLRERMQAQQDACDEMIGSPLGSLRYPFSAMAIANLSRAAETTIKHEVLRRMTLTAIALERFRLRHGSHPQNLQMLVPEFLAEVPLDLWSGKPLCYVLNPDGTIILYSVGEDGVDDGGECTPAAAPVRIDFWTGKDVVWPRVYSATNSVGE